MRARSLYGAHERIEHLAFRVVQHRGAAEPMRLVDHGDPRAGRGGRERSGEAARSASDHQHVAESIALGGRAARARSSVTVPKPVSARNMRSQRGNQRLE